MRLVSARYATSGQFQATEERVHVRLDPRQGDKFIVAKEPDFRRLVNKVSNWMEKNGAEDCTEGNDLLETLSHLLEDARHD